MKSVKFFFLSISIIWANYISAQIINPDFDDWEIIHTTGQPYENPVGWKTNNETEFTGLATTPVTKELDSTGYHARIESNRHLIDAYGPGELSQTIPTEGLLRIDYSSRCDSIFQNGKCVVNIFGQIPGDLLYTDSISIATSEFHSSSIDITPAWKMQNMSFTIQFVAKGNLDMWDEEEDGYSVFLVDHVISNYITPTKEANKADDFNIYPNPTSGMINLTSNELFHPTQIELTTILGEDVYKSKYINTIDLSWLSDGAYLIKLSSATVVIGKILIIKK